MPKDVVLASLIEDTSNDVTLICEKPNFMNTNEMKMENLISELEQYELDFL
jgi:hypothetical protein